MTLTNGNEGSQYLEEKGIGKSEISLIVRWIAVDIYTDNKIVIFSQKERFLVM